MAQWVKWLPCKHGELSLDPKCPCRSQERRQGTVIPALGWLETGRSRSVWLNRRASRLVRDPVSKSKVGIDWGRHLTLCLGLHTYVQMNTPMHMHMNKHTSKECWALVCMDQSSTSVWLLEILKCSWVSPGRIHVQILRTQYGNQWGRSIMIDAMPTCAPRKQIWLQGNFKSNYLLVISIHQFMCRCSTFL